MLRFINWLAKISGVADKIRKETCKEIGSNMQQYAYWFTGGIMVEGSRNEMSNILYEYPKWCLNHGSPHLIGSQFINLREKLWHKKESIIIEENAQTRRNKNR